MGDMFNPCKVFVANMTPQTRESDLERIFGAFNGGVDDVHLAWDKVNNLSRCFAFVTFRNEVPNNFYDKHFVLTSGQELYLSRAIERRGAKHSSSSTATNGDAQRQTSSHEVKYVDMARKHTSMKNHATGVNENKKTSVRERDISSPATDEQEKISDGLIQHYALVPLNLCPSSLLKDVAGVVRYQTKHDNGEEHLINMVRIV